MSNEKFEQYRKDRVDEVLSTYMTREELAFRIVELESKIHASSGIMIHEEFEIAKFLARRELEGEWTPGD